MSKIKVPEGMLKAAVDAAVKSSGASTIQSSPRVKVEIEESFRAALEAAFLWLSKNPIMPTDGELVDLFQSYPEGPSVVGPKQVIEWWQRRMFLAPEPEVPVPEVVAIYTPGGSYKCTVVENGSGAKMISSVQVVERFTEDDPIEPKPGELWPRKVSKPIVPEVHPVLKEWLTDAKEKGADETTQINYRRLFDRAFEAGKKAGVK